LKYIIEHKSNLNLKCNTNGGSLPVHLVNKNTISSNEIIDYLHDKMLKQKNKYVPYVTKINLQYN